MSGMNILIADDEVNLRNMLAILLEREGYQIVQAVDGADALNKATENVFDLIISDMRMPGMGGIELLRTLRAKGDQVPVIVVTAFSSTDEAVEAMKLGAYDYITKPFKNDEIRLVVQKALERKKLQDENLQLKMQLGQRFSFSSLIGQGAAMKKLVALLERVAPSQANILITGESGTGKEVVAKAIHHNSSRKDKPFVPINCGAIPENLLESELFGYEKGAFTGADKKKEGLFEAAHQGTLFLDEVGELPMGMQVKLLRVLQEREFRRVGGTKDISLDIRLVAATNQNLSAMVAEGTFREDLYYRLNVISIELPPLRERLEDIPLLVDNFYKKMTGRQGFVLGKPVLDVLYQYDWPGNIRELENLIERCVVLDAGEGITLDLLPDSVKTKKEQGSCLQTTDLPAGFDLERWLEQLERNAVCEALKRTGGVKKKAAVLLGISFRSLRYRLEKLGIEDG